METTKLNFFLEKRLKYNFFFLIFSKILTITTINYISIKKKITLFSIKQSKVRRKDYWQIRKKKNLKIITGRHLQYLIK